MVFSLGCLASQGGDTIEYTSMGSHCRSATAVKVLVNGQGPKNRTKSTVKCENFQPTIKKCRKKIVAKLPVKDRSRLLVIGQGEISANICSIGEEFDRLKPKGCACLITASQNSYPGPASSQG